MPTPRQRYRSSAAPASPVPTITRVVGYVRVSTDEQTKYGYSLDTQEAELRRHCLAKFGEGGFTLSIVRDEGVSGSLGWEPPAKGRRKYRLGLAEVARRIRASEVDVLMVTKLDRIFRNLGKQYQFFDEFLDEQPGTEGKCTIDSIAEGDQLHSLMGQMTAGLFGLLADFERRQISYRVGEGMKARRADGYFTGQLGYGWRRTARGNNRRTGLEPYSEEARWVQLAFQLALKGLGTRQIARELETQGAPAPGKTRGWSDQKVWRMLRQPIHAGMIYGDEGLQRGVHWEDRLVEPRDWERVQEELEVRKRDIAHHADKEIQPLWRVASCGTCGSRITVLDTDGLNQYRCRGSASAGDVLPPDDPEAESDELWAQRKAEVPCAGRWCPGWTKVAAQIDSAVVELLEGAVRLPAFQEMVAEEAEGLLLGKLRETAGEELAAARKRHADLERQLQRLIRANLVEAIPEDLYAGEMRRLKGDLGRAAAEVALLERQREDHGAQRALLRELRETLPRFSVLWEAMTPEERRLLVKDLTEYVLIERTGQRRARVRLKVRFLPEQVRDLAATNSRAAGARLGVEALTQRELALLTLHRQGLTIKEIAERWGAEVSGVHAKSRSIRQRLGVETLDEAVELAASRLDREGEALPLDAATGDGGYAPWRTGQLGRIAQVLEGRLRGWDLKRIALEHGMSLATARNMEWKARRIYGVGSGEEAARCYAELRDRGEDPFAALEAPELQRALRLQR